MALARSCCRAGAAGLPHRPLVLPLLSAFLTIVLSSGLFAEELPAPPPAVLEPLGPWQLTLEASAEPPGFVLRYRGPLREIRGPICYRFAGYNEVCLWPRLQWLTPATELRLPAPGGVPGELLKGYEVLLRLPRFDERTYRVGVGVGVGVSGGETAERS